MFKRGSRWTPPTGVAAVLFGIQLTLLGVILALIGAGAIALVPAGLGLLVSYNALYTHDDDRTT